MAWSTTDFCYHILSNMFMTMMTTMMIILMMMMRRRRRRRKTMIKKTMMIIMKITMIRSTHNFTRAMKADQSCLLWADRIVKVNSIMMLMKFVDLSQSDCSNWAPQNNVSEATIHWLPIDIALTADWLWTRRLNLGTFADLQILMSAT